MKNRYVFATLLALGIPALALSPFASTPARAGEAGPTAVASGKSAKPSADAAAPKGAKKNDPDNVTALSEFMETAIQGNVRYLAKDYAGAIELYRKAIQLSPKNPLGHYLLGEAQLAAGNPTEADAAFKEAESVSDDRGAGIRAKIFFAEADLRERDHKWDEAKTAWQVYGDYAAKHPEAGAAPQTPPARVLAIDEMLKQDKAYVIVRERILAEKDAGPDAKAAAKPGAKK